MVRILHTADWQIGKQFGQFEPDDAALIAAARIEAVERLAAYAAGQRIDLVLVAGDIFDAQGVSDKTIRRLFNATAPFAGKWVMIPGNHDAGLSESVWTRAERLHAIPANVLVCLAPAPLLLQEHSIAVLPAPLTQRHTYNDVTDWFVSAETPDGWFRIGLAHGSVQGILADDIDSTNPIAANRADQAQLDYLALGDWHGTKRIDDRTWYSGTPEPDRFKANDAGKALVVELANAGAHPIVTPIDTASYRWIQEVYSINVASDTDEVIRRLSSFETSHVVRLELLGASDLANHKRLLDAISTARGHTRALDVDQSMLRLAPTEDDISGLKADGYLGDVIAELRTAQDGPQAEVARDALIVLAGILDTWQTK